jgi:hypothetical protein
VQAPDHVAKGKPSDLLLFAAHDDVDVLVLEVFCIPSIILIAYAGMAMITRLGGFESRPWAHQGYLAASMVWKIPLF